MNKKELTIEDILEKKSPDGGGETFAKKLERINKGEIKKHLSGRWIIDIYDDDESEYIYLDELIIKRFLQDTLPEDNEGDVVEIKQYEGENLYGKYKYGNCTCGKYTLGEFDKYCPRCGKKIKLIA